jgi:hypothetical protein
MDGSGGPRTPKATAWNCGSLRRGTDPPIALLRWNRVPGPGRRCSNNGTHRSVFTGGTQSVTGPTDGPNESGGPFTGGEALGASSEVTNTAPSFSALSFEARSPRPLERTRRPKRPTR